MPQIDYYLTLVSPYAYMGHDRFVEIANRNGVDVNIKPVNMGAIFSETGGLPLAKSAPARQAYRFQELKRWRSHLNLPLVLEPKFFPANDRDAAGMVIAAILNGENGVNLAGAFLRAVWAEERDVADHDTIISIANDLGMDGKALLSKSDTPDVVRIWEQNTTDGKDAGVFGAPTYICGDQMFWGQDRLDFLEHALQADC